MEFKFKPLLDGGDIYLTADQVKSDYILVVKGPEDFYIKHNQTEKGYYLAKDDELFLDAIGIAIRALPASNKKKPGSGGSFTCKGNVTGSNIVQGNNNDATNTHNGVSVNVIGDNLYVGPK